MVQQDYSGHRPAAGRRRAVQVATVCGIAACLAALVVTYSQRRAVLMADQGLDAATIGIDHNAMLASNSQQNAAFLQTFGNYLPHQAPTLATGTTQLAQSPQSKKSDKQSAQDRLNAKLAAQMQSQLTAGTQGDSLMTPHFVAALEQATGHGQQESPELQLAQKATMEALTMTQSKQHILPSDLRQKFALSTTKNTLGGLHNLTPQQAAMRAHIASTQSLSQTSFSRAAPSPTGGNPASASNADNSFLAAEPAPQLTAQQLIQQAALKQMNSLPAPAPTPAAAAKQPEAPLASQRLAQYPAPAMQQYGAPQFAAVPNYAPLQQASTNSYTMQTQMAYQQPPAYAQPAYAQQPPLYAPTQMAYQLPGQQPASNGYYQQPAQPATYSSQQAVTQEMYQLASPVKPGAYQAPPQMMAQQRVPEQPYTYNPAQAAVNTASPAAMMAYQPPQMQMQQPLLAMPQPQTPAQQQQMQQQMGDTSNVGLQTPEQIGEAAAKGVTGNWRAPDLSLKGHNKGKLTAAARNKIKQQMLALRSSILADYKKNSRMADTALLLGPGGL